MYIQIKSQQYLSPFEYTEYSLQGHSQTFKLIHSHVFLSFSTALWPPDPNPVLWTKDKWAKSQTNLSQIQEVLVAIDTKMKEKAENHEQRNGPSKG